MKTQPFKPFLALAKLVTISLSSQSVDLVVSDLADDCRQLEITNTSTGAISVKFGNTSGTVTATIADTGGILINAGSKRTYTRPDGVNRVAVIGTIANGYCQILPGTGY